MITFHSNVTNYLSSQTNYDVNMSLLNKYQKLKYFYRLPSSKKLQYAGR